MMSSRQWPWPMQPTEAWPWKVVRLPQSRQPVWLTQAKWAWLEKRVLRVQTGCSTHEKWGWKIPVTCHRCCPEISGEVRIVQFLICAVFRQRLLHSIPSTLDIVKCEHQSLKYCAVIHNMCSDNLWLCSDKWLFVDNAWTRSRLESTKHKNKTMLQLTNLQE